jgi:hypothetical protein
VLGGHLLKARRPGEAAEQYEAALAEADANVWDQSTAHCGLADCAMSAGDPIRAVHEARLAVQIAEPLGDSWLVESTVTLAMACSAAGDFDAGWQAASRSMDAAARIGNHHYSFAAALVAVDVALDRDDLTAARQLLGELDSHAAPLDAATGTTRRADEVAARRNRYAEAVGELG